MPTMRNLVHAHCSTYNPSTFIYVSSPIKTEVREVKGHLTHVYILNAQQVARHSEHGIVVEWMIPFSGFSLAFPLLNTPQASSESIFSPHVMTITSQTHTQLIPTVLSPACILSFSLVFPKASGHLHLNIPLLSQIAGQTQSNFFLILSNLSLLQPFPPVLTISMNVNIIFQLVGLQTFLSNYPYLVHCRVLQFPLSTSTFTLIQALPLSLGTYVPLTSMPIFPFHRNHPVTLKCTFMGSIPRF